MAGSFNKVILMGNLTRDPELRYTPQGTAVTDICLAINDSRSRDNQKTTYADIVVWDKAAEIVCEYMRKGSSMLVEGRLTTDSWEDRDTGKRVYKLKVVCQNFQFTGSKSESSNSQKGNTGFAGQGSGGYQNNSYNYNDSPPDDDIPF